MLQEAGDQPDGDVESLELHSQTSGQPQRGRKNGELSAACSGLRQSGRGTRAIANLLEVSPSMVTRQVEDPVNRAQSRTLISGPRGGRLKSDNRGLA